jgi:hypothetical protein
MVALRSFSKPERLIKNLPDSGRPSRRPDSLVKAVGGDGKKGV